MVKTVRALQFLPIASLLIFGSPAGRAADIIETVRETGKFDTFVKVIEAAGGVEWLKEKRVTLFAPTDAAFDRLKEGVLDRLTEPEHKDELELLIEHHVVPDQALTSADLGGYTRLEMAEGEPLLVGAAGGGKIEIGDATVVEADIRADNGVIHAVDEVLVPELVWNMLERSE